MRYARGEAILRVIAMRYAPQLIVSQNGRFLRQNENSPQQAAGYPRGGLALKIRDFQTSEYLLRRSKLRGIRPIAIEGLRQQGTPEAALPAPSTMAVILNRLGFRLRPVVKSKPLKKLPETDAIFANVKKKTRKPRPTVR